ncbi:uncharacterized protein DEA37_0009277 [Paragonimus westermani]|uniref:Fibrous sheath-interacting protein 1 n=1 Tax=Paragonimus westermani TaxID=34504 RepID=A0A5J4NAU5_9TREM|nr:uncharacterized protein DEA37_0009277 [Paragonimus westermani]
MSGSQPDATILTGDLNSEDMGDQRRIQAGRIRIEFLDRVLRSKIQREKIVKQQGRALRRSIQLQLLDFVQPRLEDCHQEIRTITRHSFGETHTKSPKERCVEGHAAGFEVASTKIVESSKNPEILNNIARFLALEASPSIKPSSSFNPLNKKQCSSSDDEARTRNENRTSLKIFTTEYDIDEDDSDNANDGWLNTEQTQSTSWSATNQLPLNAQSRERISEVVDEPPVVKPVELNTSKDFIQRNIELAAKANQILPLTAAEEARLDFLLHESEDEHADEEGEYLWECSEQDHGPSIFVTDQINSVTVNNSPIGTNALTTIEEGWTLSSCTSGVLQQPILPTSDVNLVANENDEGSWFASSSFVLSDQEGKQICLQLTEIDKRLSQLLLYREIERCFADVQLENKAIEGGLRDIPDEKLQSDKTSKLNRPRELALEEALQSREECARLNEINRRLLSIEKESATQRVCSIPKVASGPSSSWRWDLPLGSQLAIREAGTVACGTGVHGINKHWISEKSLELLEARRNTPPGSPYNKCRRDVRRKLKRSLKADREAWLLGKVREMETAFASGNTGKLFKLIRATGLRRPSALLIAWLGLFVSHCAALSLLYDTPTNTSLFLTSCNSVRVLTCPGTLSANPALSNAAYSSVQTVIKDRLNSSLFLKGKFSSPVSMLEGREHRAQISIGRTDEKTHCPPIADTN